MPETATLCCDDSLEAGEQLAGTTPRADVWLLLENPAPWGAKAFEESALPDAIKEQLSAWLKAIPRSRLQFIRRARSDSRRAFYVVLARQARLYRFELAAYDSLLTLDIPALVGDAAGYEDYRSDEKLFLVCVNARRDACCALRGVPLYQRMRAVGGEAVWQTNHLGGHRFAGTCVCLPHGLYYGRVDDPAPIIQAYRRDELYSAKCRGRSTYEPAAQAAEIYLCEQLGRYGLDTLRLLDVEQHENRWTARFAADEGVYTVEVREEPIMVLENSGAPERKPVMQHRAVAYALQRYG